jgi:hypothetical protein
MRTIVRLLIVLSLTLATSLQAATYIVPTDRDLVMRSEAIVVATVVASHSEITSDGRVVTIATLALEEVVKGDLERQTSIDLIEPGGVVGNRVTFIAGSPRYTSGRQYLVFLRRTPDGWATYGFGLGQFQFASDPFGHPILIRGIGEEISGWDETDNRSHVERLRDANAFTTFVKTVAANSGAPARSNYLLHPEQSEFTPVPAVSVPGGLDGVSAISAATGNWTGAGAGIHYGVGASNPNASGGLSTVDHINAVLFNDPAGIIPPGVAAAGGVSDVATVGPNVFTTEVDVVVGKNFSVGQATLNALMTHEMGHTLGLRHSNEGTTNGSACNPPLVCSSNAIMNSAVGVLSLQQWDLDAIRTVYAGQTGTGAPADYLSNTKWQSPPSINFDFCFAPTISGQPSGASIASGAQTTLNVTATGTSATYQWYVGNPPNTGTMATNGTNSSLTVSPTTTTTYWVRVTACGGHLDSNGATVTVTACVPPSAPAPNASPSTIASGQSSTITETPTGTGPFTYQWFTGTSGNTASPIGGATNSSVTVSPTTTTSYWVRVTGQCAPPADSPVATVTVAACVPPSASVPIASPASIPNGQTSTLSVSASGTSPFTYQWFVGSSGVTTTPIGGATNSFVVVNPSVTTTYWVRVTGQCAPPADSRDVTVTVTCSPIASGGITAQPSTISAGQSSTLFFATNGTGPFTIQWYTGGLGDTSNPIPGATGTSTVVSPAGTTGYWVHVTAPCGSQDGSVIVFVAGAPCIAPSITTQPASSSISAGSPVTLTVAASGTAPLTFQWYTGDKGDITHPIAGATTASLTQSPAATTKYWARVSNSCNGTQSADSNAATITITGPVCTAPSITTQPSNASAPIGTSATLKVIAAGTAPLHYQWFQGVKGDTSKPVGTDSATFVSGAIDVNTAFWVHVTGQCGSPADSNAAVVTAIAAPRGRAVRH